MVGLEKIRNRFWITVLDDDDPIDNSLVKPGRLWYIGVEEKLLDGLAEQ